MIIEHEWIQDIWRITYFLSLIYFIIIPGLHFFSLFIITCNNRILRLPLNFFAIFTFQNIVIYFHQT